MACRTTDPLIQRKGPVEREWKRRDDRKQETAGGTGIQKQGDTRERAHEFPVPNPVVKKKKKRQRPWILNYVKYMCQEL